MSHCKQDGRHVPSPACGTSAMSPEAAGGKQAGRSVCVVAERREACRWTSCDTENAIWILIAGRKRPTELHFPSSVRKKSPLDHVNVTLPKRFSTRPLPLTTDSTSGNLGNLKRQLMTKVTNVICFYIELILFYLMNVRWIHCNIMSVLGKTEFQANLKLSPA